MRKTSSTDRISTPILEVRNASQSHPRVPQDPPGASQECLETAWERSKTVLKALQDTPEQPKGAPERFGSELESILVLWMMIFDVFGGHFEGFMHELSNEFSLHAACIFEDTSFDLLSKAPLLNF